MIQFFSKTFVHWIKNFYLEMISIQERKNRNNNNNNNKNYQSNDIDEKNNYQILMENGWNLIRVWDIFFSLPVFFLFYDYTYR